MRPTALLLTFLMLLAPMAGCIGSEEPPAPVVEEEVIDGVWVTGGDGLPVDVEPFDTTYYINDVGQQGPEPSIGVIPPAASSSSPSRRSCAPAIQEKHG